MPDTLVGPRAKTIGDEEEILKSRMVTEVVVMAMAKTARPIGHRQGPKVDNSSRPETEADLEV